MSRAAHPQVWRNRPGAWGTQRGIIKGGYSKLVNSSGNFCSIKYSSNSGGGLLNCCAQGLVTCQSLKDCAR